MWVEAYVYEEIDDVLSSALVSHYERVSGYSRMVRSHLVELTFSNVVLHLIVQVGAEGPLDWCYARIEEV